MYGTDGGGIFKISPSGALTYLTAETPNFEETRSSLLYDGHGSFYGFVGKGIEFDQDMNNLGKVFKFTPGTNTFTTVATFTKTNGAFPSGTLVMDSQGNLYGTTMSGGSENRGTVFKIAAGTNAIITVVSFNGKNGDQPRGGVILDRDGNLYGTTFGGGANDKGTVFKIRAAIVNAAK